MDELTALRTELNVLKARNTAMAKLLQELFYCPSDALNLDGDTAAESEALYQRARALTAS